MFTNRDQNRSHTATTVLGALTLLSSCCFTPESAQGQERAFALLTELTSRFSPKPEVTKSLLRNRFERTLTDSDNISEQLRNALQDPSLLRITCGSAAAPKLQDAWEVQLTDGTNLSLTLTTKPEFAVKNDEFVTVHDQTGDYTIPVSAIRSIRPQRNLLYDPAWSEHMAEHSLSDTLLIRKPHGVLDLIEGVALRCTPTHLEFNYDGEVLKVSYAKIEGVRMASRSLSSKTPASVASATVQTEAHTISCKDLRVSDEPAPKLVAETPAGATLAVSLAHLVIDRSSLLALTARDLAIASRRLAIEDWQLTSQSAHRWPLAVSPEIYSLTGQGIETQLTIHGPAEVELAIPKGYSRLYFELAIFGVPVAPVTFHYAAHGAESTVIYQQPRFPSPEQVIDLRNELPLPGAGTLRIHVPGDARFSTFLLSPDSH
jgi:hypothetical protein